MRTTNKTGPLLILLGVSLWLLVFLPGPAFSQTAERLDAVLDAERVSFSQAAAIVLPAAGLLAPEAGETEAFAMARPWLPRWADRDDSITMGELSYLVMQSFHLTGGFMYALFPGPRYAYRTLAWRRLLPPASDPGRFLTGEELLHITGRVLSLAGETELWALSLASPLEAEQGQRLSSGSPEGVLPYRGEFELE